MRDLSIDDYDKGCTNLGCIPECRFYPKYGRIEDEVIEEHNKLVEKHAIVVEPPYIDGKEKEDYLEFLEEQPFLK